MTNPITVTAGPESTAASRRRAEDLQLLQEQELVLVRDAAEKWRNGLAALTGLLATVLVVRGRDTLDGLGTTTKILVASLTLGALLAAAAGALLAMRAAYGPPHMQPLAGRADDLPMIKRTAAIKTVADLRHAIVLTFATLILMAATVGVAAFGPSRTNIVRVTTSGGTTCGELEATGGSTVTIKPSGNATSVTIELADVSALQVVDSC